MYILWTLVHDPVDFGTEVACKETGQRQIIRKNETQSYGSKVKVLKLFYDSRAAREGIRRKRGSMAVLLR